MTSFAEAREVMGAAFKRAGLLGRGSIWRLKGTNVQWVVRIDRSPVGNRVGIDIGLDLDVSSAPRLPTDCPILLHLENLAITEDLALLMALDLDTGMGDPQRSLALIAATEALGAYLHRHLTLEQVAEAYDRGDFRAGFIQKDARELLDGEISGR